MDGRGRDGACCRLSVCWLPFASIQSHAREGKQEGTLAKGIAARCNYIYTLLGTRNVYLKVLGEICFLSMSKL